MTCLSALPLFSEINGNLSLKFNNGSDTRLEKEVINSPGWTNTQGLVWRGALQA